MGANTVSRAPGQRRQSTPWRGRGFLSLEKPPSPAAAGGFNYVVDGTYWRRLLAISFTLTTSATAADRVTNLQFLDGDGAVINQQGLIELQQASQVSNVSADLTQPSGNENQEGIKGYGTQTSPAALTNILSIAGLPVGAYELEWTVELAGTVAAGTDNDNFQAVANGAVIGRSANAAAVGVYPQENLPFIQEGGSSLAIQNIALATTGAIYSCTVTVLVQGNFIVEAQIPDLTLKSGWQINVQGINYQAGDQISNLVMLFERYPSSDYQEGDDSPADQLAALILDIASGV